MQLSLATLYCPWYVAPVTPPPEQPLSVPLKATVVLTVFVLDSGGNGGVNVAVPWFVLHVVPPAAAAGWAVMTPIGSIIAAAHNKPSVFRIRPPSGSIRPLVDGVGVPTAPGRPRHQSAGLFPRRRGLRNQSCGALARHALCAASFGHCQRRHDTTQGDNPNQPFSGMAIYVLVRSWWLAAGMRGYEAHT